MAMASCGLSTLNSCTKSSVNHQVLVRNPDWALWADMDAAMAASARKRLLDMAATDKIQIAAYHLPFPSCQKPSRLMSCGAPTSRASSSEARLLLQAVQARRPGCLLFEG